MPESTNEKLKAHITQLRNMQSDIESGQPPDGERLAVVVEQIVTDMPALGPVIQSLIDIVKRDDGVDHA